MRTLNIPLEEEEYKKLLNAKGDISWKEFILQRCIKDINEKELI